MTLQIDTDLVKEARAVSRQAAIETTRHFLLSLAADLADRPTFFEVLAEEARRLEALRSAGMGEVQRAMKDVAKAVSIQPALASLTFPVGVEQRPAPQRRRVERYAWRTTGAVAAPASPGTGRQ